jgi:hypothetical protein
MISEAVDQQIEQAKQIVQRLDDVTAELHRQLNRLQDPSSLGGGGDGAGGGSAGSGREA